MPRYSNLFKVKRKAIHSSHSKWASPLFRVVFLISNNHRVRVIKMQDIRWMVIWMNKKTWPRRTANHVESGSCQDSSTTMYVSRKVSLCPSLLTHPSYYHVRSVKKSLVDSNSIPIIWPCTHRMMSSSQSRQFWTRQDLISKEMTECNKESRSRIMAAVGPEG